MSDIGPTNVPAILWTSGGPIAPSGPAILAGVQQDWNVTFNVTFNWNNQSAPQSQLAATWAAVINNANQLITYIASQVDPAYAQYRMQDAIARINFLTREAAEPTTIQVQCFGANVTIPAGPASYGTVEDPAGNIYQCTEAGSIPVEGGSINLSFAAVVAGPTPVPSNVTIYQQIDGWDSATVVSGAVGQNAETSQQFELRRQQSVAANAINTNDAVLGSVLSVPGVLDAYVIDNPTSEPATIGGYTLAANSLYVAATGGSAAAVAQAIWLKKPPGIPLNGNTTVTVTDTNSGYSPPAPTYQISFEIPAPLQVLFALNLANSALVPSNAITLIQNAIIAAFQGTGATFTGSISGTILTVSAITQGAITVGQLINGGGVTANTLITALGNGQGGVGTYQISRGQTVASTSMTASLVSNTPTPPRARIGSTIYANQYAAVVAALGSWAAIKSLQIGSNNTSAASIVGSISGTTLTAVSVLAGAVASGQTLSGSGASGTGVATGTTIINQLSGTPGGTGTYLVSTAQTVAGATFTGSGTGAFLTATSVTGYISAGDVISGTGVPLGTTILSQESGTPGGAGIYVTSGATTASGTITCNAPLMLAVANQNYVVVGIAQEPQINANNITVTVS